MLSVLVVYCVFFIGEGCHVAVLFCHIYVVFALSHYLGAKMMCSVLFSII